MGPNRMNWDSKSKPSLVNWENILIPQINLALYVQEDRILLATMLQDVVWKMIQK